MELTEQIADRISSDGGGALIIDYGKDGIVSDSLQVWILKPFHYYLTWTQYVVDCLVHCNINS